MLTLNYEKRDDKSSLEALRESGYIPAVFYGPKVSSTSVKIKNIDFTKVWKKAGESSVISLKGSDGEEHEALIHEIDFHPVTDTPRHADFYVIEKGKKLEVAVPLVFVGVSPAVKDKGGILVKVRRDMKVEAAPKDLPHEIKVDISSLVEVTDVITAKQLPIPTGVEIKINPDDVVASIAVAKEEVEEAPTAIDMSTIEVESKGKEDKEGTEGAGEAKVEDKKAEKK